MKQNSRKERGSSLVEHAMLVALIAVVSITAVRSFSNAIEERFEANALALGDGPISGGSAEGGGAGGEAGAED